MKIVLVITGLGMGGAERQVCDLADKFFSRGYQVKIAYLLKPVVVKPKNENIELIWLGGGKTPVSMFNALIKLIKLLRKEKPNVVHSHMFHANILSRISRVFVSFPRLISTAHSSNEGGKPRMLAYRFTDFLATVFSNVSDDAVEKYEKRKAAPVGKMITTVNGIDTDYFHFTQEARNKIRKKYDLENKRVFIAIGRFHEAKDYPNLLKSFFKLTEKHTDIHLLIVGDGELRSSLEKIISSKNMTNSVTLLGIRNDIPELLSAADIYVMSSAWEGLPLVIAEAMAVERVLVSTDCGGTREMIGDSGFLVAPQNSAELAKGMENALLLSSEEEKALGIAARNRIKSKYSLDSVVDNWLKIYSFKK